MAHTRNTFSSFSLLPGFCHPPGKGRGPTPALSLQCAWAQQLPLLPCKDLLGKELILFCPEKHDKGKQPSTAEGLQEAA